MTACNTQVAGLVHVKGAAAREEALKLYVVTQLVRPAEPREVLGEVGNNQAYHDSAPVLDDPLRGSGGGGGCPEAISSRRFGGQQVGGDRRCRVPAAGGAGAGLHITRLRALSTACLQSRTSLLASSLASSAASTSARSTPSGTPASIASSRRAAPMDL